MGFSTNLNVDSLFYLISHTAVQQKSKDGGNIEINTITTLQSLGGQNSPIKMKINEVYEVIKDTNTEPIYEN